MMNMQRQNFTPARLLGFLVIAVGVIALGCCWYVIFGLKHGEQAHYFGGAFWIALLMCLLMLLLLVISWWIALQLYRHKTVLMQSDDALRASEDRFQMVFEHATVGISITAPHGPLLKVNAALAAMLGYTIDELQTTDFTTVTHPDDLEQSWAGLNSLLANTCDSYRVDKRYLHKDGHVVWADVSVTLQRDAVGTPQYFITSVLDISKRKELEARQELTMQVLSLLNREDDILATVKQILHLIKEQTSIEAAGIRLREGEDFPYYATEGFPEYFIEKERYLCERDDSGELMRNANGNPVLECMCGNILQQRFMPELPFFTVGGSFWTNNTTALLASTTEEDRQARTRNHCNGEGYESVTLIPLHSDEEVVGLLQFNDHRPDRFTLEMIQFFEGLSASIGIALKRKQMEKALYDSALRYITLYESSSDGVVFTDDETQRITDANPAFCSMLGYSLEEVRTLRIADLHHKEALPGIMSNIAILKRRSRVQDMDLPCIRKDGSILYVDVTGVAITVDGKVQNVGFFRDITERKAVEAKHAELEEQIRQQQRLEVVGQLAAGVAHDFNNLLTGMIGYTQLALDDLPEGSASGKDLTEVLALSKKAANVTHQLLAFSRKQPMQPIIFNMNERIVESLKMLGRLLGEYVLLEFHPDANLGDVKADPGQFEQVLMNLAVNARDAMPAGGTLTVATKNVDLNEDNASFHHDISPGLYVLLTVTDTGCGMEEFVREHIFEPFFTTKDLSKGTGLGLATVYGIIKQHHGDIRVSSEPGVGSCFQIYLPRIAEADTAQTTASAQESGSGTETILIVEDDDTVREVTCRYLVANGYHVLSAAVPSQAEELLLEAGDRITLLLTDMMMPERSGRQLYEAVRLHYPHLRVLYMSGYSAGEIAHHGGLDADISFIQKPFTEESLCRQVRLVLDEGK